MRAYTSAFSLLHALSIKHASKHSEHTRGERRCHLDTHAHINERERGGTILCTVFVPLSGNWRVFIRLMDMKRKGRRGMKITWGREGGGEDGREGGR